MTEEESREVNDITTAVYAGSSKRLLEHDVRYLIALLVRLENRLTPDCKCSCHGTDDHCSSCCEGPLCDDCRFYARTGG